MILAELFSEGIFKDVYFSVQHFELGHLQFPIARGFKRFSCSNSLIISNVNECQEDRYFIPCSIREILEQDNVWYFQTDKSTCWSARTEVTAHDYYVSSIVYVVNRKSLQGP